jgi:hypothetical protein
MSVKAGQAHQVVSDELRTTRVDEVGARLNCKPVDGFARLGDRRMPVLGGRVAAATVLLPPEPPSPPGLVGG